MGGALNRSERANLNTPINFAFGSADVFFLLPASNFDH